MKKVKAFTLIELLVVIVIIGILAALIVLSLSTARAKAKDARAKSAVSDTATAVEMYINDNEGVTNKKGFAETGDPNIGTLLKSDAIDARGEAVKYKIVSQTEYYVVGLATKGTGNYCWYAGSSSSNLSSPTPTTGIVCSKAD